MRTIVSLLAALLLASSLPACATSGSEEELGQDESEAAGAGTFSLWQSSDGQYRFHVKSGNGAVLLSSEGYTSRTSAINGMLSVQTNGVDEAMYRVVQVASGFVVHLLAGNHEIIGASQVYASKASAKRGVGSAVHAVTSYLDKREANVAGPRFAITAGASGQFHFNVYGAGGQVALSSEAYTTEAAAYNGAFAVQLEGQNAANYDIKQNAAGAYYFTLRARNGEVIGVGQPHATREAAQASMAALIKSLPAISVL